MTAVKTEHEASFLLANQCKSLVVGNSHKSVVCLHVTALIPMTIIVIARIDKWQPSLRRGTSLRTPATRPGLPTFAAPPNLGANSQDYSR